MQLPGHLRSTTLGDLLGALHRAAATGTLELIEDRGREHHIHWMRGLVVAVELDGASPSLGEILRGDGVADEDVLRRSLLRSIASHRLHGEVLMDEFRVPPARVGSALRRQMLARLSALEQLGDARLSFRVAVRPPRSALVASERDAASRPSWNAPLGAREFLHGRRRARERAGVASSARWDDRSEQRGSERDRYERRFERDRFGGGSERDRCEGRFERDRFDPEAAGAKTLAWGVLGLAPGADVADIKRAYRRLARTLHPDLHPGADDPTRRSLQRRFAELTDAYRALVP